MNSILQIQRKVKINEIRPVIIRGTRGYKEWVIVRVFTDQGVDGVGEGFTWSRHARKINSHIKVINEQVLGTDFISIENFLNRFIPQAQDRNWYAAISAVEIALWDIVGKLAGLPVYALLGGPIHKTIPLYANHGFFQENESWEETVKRAKDEGFKMFKWDPFHKLTGTPDPSELREKINRVEQVRNAVGSEYLLAIDAHNRFSVEGAIMAAKALEPLNIMFFEAPTKDDPENLRRVAEATSLPIATGELTCTRKEAKNLFDSRALKIFQPEVGTNGGILESCKTASLAEVYDTKIATHNWCGPIITRAATHVCACVANLLYQEYASGKPQDQRINQLLDPPTQVENGHIILPDGSGLGSKIDEKILASMQVE